jgi:hypothetical protein
MYRDSDRTLSGERVSTRRLSGRPRASWVATPLARCAHVRPAHLAMRRARPQRAESSSDALLASLLHSLHVAKSIRELAVKQYTLMNTNVVSTSLLVSSPASILVSRTCCPALRPPTPSTPMVHAWPERPIADMHACQSPLHDTIFFRPHPISRGLLAHPPL